MDFVRRFDRNLSSESGYRGYLLQILASQESALIVGSWISAGGCGPSLHYHSSDQFYYLVSGEINVQLGDDIHRVHSDTFVFIPAGLAHRNWNDGPDDEFHLEVIAPTPLPGQQILTLVKSPEEAPNGAAAGYVYDASQAEFVTPTGMDGFAVRRLAETERLVVNEMKVPPGGRGPGTHVHEFDQYYLVLEGVLDVEVGLQKHRVEKGSLVILPAGVPHRQWNSSSEGERHIAVLAPAPSADVPWDRGVDFTPNGVNHSG